MRITTHINRGKELADGSHPIRIAIHRGNDREVLYLKGHSIHSMNWNPVTGMAYTTKKECPKGYSLSDHASAINAAISDAINKAEAICKLNPDKPLSEIKELIKDKIRPEEKITNFAPKAASFNEFLLSASSTYSGVDQFGYSARFTVVAKKLRQYFDKPDVRFTDITKESMQGFITWMMKDKKVKDKLVKGNKASTARGAIKLIKTAYYEAQSDGKVSKDTNPFKGLKYGVKTNERDARLKWLTMEQIEAIHNLELTGFRRLTRDVFCFQFYANGDRVRDSVQLHKRDLNNGYYHFKQTKTRDEKQVKLPPKALEILDRYPAKGHLFFPELDNITNKKQRYKRCSAITTQINSDLKVISEMAGIVTEDGTPIHITSHMARHSFAAHIYKKTKDIELTRKALGHSNISQTARYLKELGVTELADTIASIWE